MSAYTYYLLAQAVAAVHLVFILYVVLGGLLCFRWPWTIWLHLPAVVWGSGIELLSWTCPLTPLEKWLLIQAGHPVYPGSFSDYHLFWLIYPSDLRRLHQILLGTVVLLVNSVLYGVLFRRRNSR